jgi:hypothetical protein
MGATELRRVGSAAALMSRGLGAAVILCLIGICVASAGAHQVARSAGFRSCGRVDSRYGPLVVYVKSGRVSCRKARSVIRYVTSHGTPTQGTPGKSPRGWSCFYGYGYYHGDHQRLGRAGPECQRGKKMVAGVDPSWVPA